MNMLSLYSGIGGIDLAAAIVGIETVAMCEADAKCRKVLRRHWPHVPIYRSDEHVTAKSLRRLGRIDIIAGGPPCQPFSVAGKQEGTADPRHRWPEMSRIVAELWPRWVVVENVGGFWSVAESLVAPDLEALGYEVGAVEIPSAAVGAPHQRARVFVVAYSDATLRDESEPITRSGSETITRDARAGLAYAGGNGREQRGREERDGGEDGEHTSRHESHGCDPRRAVAYSDDAGRGERRGTEPMGSELGPAERRGGQAMVNTSSLGRNRRQYKIGLEIRDADSVLGPPPESRLGRVLTGLSDRLDSHVWPVPRGVDQPDWEPERTTTDRHERRQRIKQLGNAVVPWQVLPILALIGGDA